MLCAHSMPSTQLAAAKLERWCHCCSSWLNIDISKSFLHSIQGCMHSIQTDATCSPLTDELLGKVVYRQCFCVQAHLLPLVPGVPIIAVPLGLGCCRSSTCFLHRPGPSWPFATAGFSCPLTTLLKRPYGACSSSLHFDSTPACGAQCIVATRCS